MTHEATTYRLLEGSGILIGHFGEELRLTSAAAVERPVRRCRSPVTRSAYTVMLAFQVATDRRVARRTRRGARRARRRPRRARAADGRPCSSSSASPGSARRACWPSSRRAPTRRGTSCSPAARPSSSATCRSGSSSTRSTSTSHGLDPRRLDGARGRRRAELAHVLPSLPLARAADRRRQDERYRTHRAVRELLERLAATQAAGAGARRRALGRLRLDRAARRAAAPPAGRAVLIALAARPRQLPERLPPRSSGHAPERCRGSSSAPEPGRGARAPGRGGRRAADRLRGERRQPVLSRAARARPGPRTGAQRRAASRSAGFGVPRGVAAALTEELALLPDEARRVLEGAAVAGDPFEPELAAAAAALPEQAADRGPGRAAAARPRAPHRRAAPLPLPAPARAARRLRGGAGRLAAGRARAQRAARWRRAAPPPAARAHHVERSARHGDTAAVAVLREAGEAAAPRAPGDARPPVRVGAPAAAVRRGPRRSGSSC